MIKQPLYKRILSYLYPVRVERAATPQNAVLELCLYRNQFQLATRDALYSDGKRYRPMVLAFDHLKKRFRRTNDVLILGTGLGSAVHILYNKGFKPNYTLVEHDEKIIEWADALLPEDIKSSVIKVCEDADTFMKGCKSQYDLIVADVFNSRDVPEFVTSQSYLQHCRRCIRPGGAFVLNYIVVNENTWRRAEQQVLNIFPACEILHNGINRILIATV